ncbi:MAG: DUF4292 domain-containing protein [Saprospiraceae bacterium]
MIRIVLILIPVLILSCSSSHRKVLESKTQEHPISDLNVLVDKINKQQEYQFYSAKGSITYNGSDFDGTAEAHLKIIKDSMAVLTIKKFGIELLRIKFDRDSICILDRIQNTWSKSSISSWTNAYSIPIDYYLIQDVVSTGFHLQDFLSYELINKKDTGIISGYSEQYQMKNKFLSNDLKPLQFEIIQNNRIGSVEIRKSTKIDQKYFPNDLFIKYQLENQGPIQKISIQWREIVLNIPESIKFEIPGHYTKI